MCRRRPERFSLRRQARPDTSGYRTFPQPESARRGCARRRLRADAQAYNAGRPGCHGSVAAARALGRGGPGCSSAALASVARGGGGRTEARLLRRERRLASQRPAGSSPRRSVTPRGLGPQQAPGRKTPGRGGTWPLPAPGLRAAHLGLSVGNPGPAPPCPLLGALLNRTNYHKTKDCSSGPG